MVVRTRGRMQWTIGLVLLGAVVGALTLPSAPVEASTAMPCAEGSGGTWVPGELNVYWFDVEQGDSQLVVGPTGKTMLIDLGETAWNRTSGTNAQRVAAAIQQICGVTGPVMLDYVMGSHFHLDHIGYAGNPSDTSGYGNGIYQLLDPAQLNFGVGTLLDRDGGTFVDSDGNGTCEVGTNASPSPDVVWRNAGTTSSTGRRWICWLYGPAGQADRANIEGKVVTLSNDTPWPAIDLGSGVSAEIVEANAKDVLQADGVTPVSGDHTSESTPPSENDYSVAVEFAYGDYQYATAGDSDGEYATSSFGYTYNDIESVLAPRFGDVDTMRVNHHGSSHSTSAGYTTSLAPETAVISCGSNSYGHAAPNVRSELASVPTANGVGADVFMTNNPCDPTVGAVPGAFNANGDVWMHTTGAGSGYLFTYDTGSRAYVADTGGTPPPGSGSVADVVINEFLPDPDTAFTQEFVELYNPTAASLDIGGLYLDDIAGGGRAPQQIPAGTTIASGGYQVVTFSGGYLNNGGDDVRLLSADLATVYDAYSYTSSANDESYHRIGDGGPWCDTRSADVTRGAANVTTCP